MSKLGAAYGLGIEINYTSQTMSTPFKTSTVRYADSQVIQYILLR